MYINMNILTLDGFPLLRVMGLSISLVCTASTMGQNWQKSVQVRWAETGKKRGMNEERTQ